MGNLVIRKKNRKKKKNIKDKWPREETLVPSLILENEGLKIGLEWSKGRPKSWSLFSYKKARQEGVFFSLMFGHLNRKTERKKSRGRREEEGKKKGRKREEKGRKVRAFLSQGM